MDDKRTKLGTGQGDLAATEAPSTPGVAKTSYLPPQTDPLIGQTLAGRYLVHKKLGEGGMGAVYLATHQLLEKHVALKVLHGEFSRKQDLVDRFIQEAKAASRIRHENVIDISDFGTTPEGLVFFAMELLNGHDLHEEVARARLAQQLLPWERSKKIFLQICAALSAAHAKGIIHRDLKPENVYLVDFLGDPDFVKLLDFGIAKVAEIEEGGRKLTKTGMLFGTPEYMSPEQARGEQVDARVDIYAMGCILFQLVTGKVPFEADNFMGVLSLHLTEPAPSIPVEVFDRIGAPRALGDVIARALLKDRTQRYDTIDDFANAVRLACGDPLVTSREGKTGIVPAQRATANVPAPSVTTERARTPTPAPPAGPVTATHNRARTQWTGSLSVPVEDEAPRTRGKSKVPLIAAGAILLAGAGIAAVVATRGGGSTTAPPSDPGSALVGSASQVAATVPPPDAPPAPPPIVYPARVKLRLDSVPRGAIVTDLATKETYKTPFRTTVAGSGTPLRYKFTLRGHGDSLIELVPDQDEIEHVEKLEKGVSGTGGTVRQVGGGRTATVAKPPEPTLGSAAGSATPTATPPDRQEPTPPEPTPPEAKEPTPGSAAKPPEPPKHDPACDEIPPPAHCLKDPTRGTGD